MDEPSREELEAFWTGDAMEQGYFDSKAAYAWLDSQTSVGPYDALLTLLSWAGLNHVKVEFWPPVYAGEMWAISLESVGNIPLPEHDEDRGVGATVEAAAYDMLSAIGIHQPKSSDKDAQA